MLTIYRRHRKSCKQRAKGRKYRHCQCPIWVDGTLGRKELRESLKLRDWQRAQDLNSGKQKNDAYSRKKKRSPSRKLM